jgi:AraC-like DNA-binding protein
MPFVELRFTRRSCEAYKAHSHKQFCVGAVTEGTTRTTVRGETFAISPGSLVLLPPEVVHSCNPLPGTPRSYIMAYLDVLWCRSIQGAVFGPQQRFIPPQVTLLQSEAQFDAFVELANSLVSHAPAREKTDRLTSFVGDLFIESCNLAAPAGSIEQSGILNEVKEYLVQQADANITLEELSAAFRCNPFHLLRCFKKSVGMTPHAFLLNARVERAKGLLLNGFSLAAAAAETGFSDQSHFHKTFQRILAATPGEYQKRSRR